MRHVKIFLQCCRQSGRIRVVTILHSPESNRWSAQRYLPYCLSKNYFNRPVRKNQNIDTTRCPCGKYVLMSFPHGHHTKPGDHPYRLTGHSATVVAVATPRCAPHKSPFGPLRGSRSLEPGRFGRAASALRWLYVWPRRWINVCKPNAPDAPDVPLIIVTCVCFVVRTLRSKWWAYFCSIHADTHKHYFE